METNGQKSEHGVFGPFGRFATLFFSIIMFGGFLFCFYLLTEEKTNIWIVAAIAFAWSIMGVASLVRVLEDTVISLADNDDWTGYIYARKKWYPDSWLKGWTHKNLTKAH